MAIFLRGNVWWFEYRTRHERVVKSTGFTKEHKKEAQAVLDAFRLARGVQPPRSAMEKILDAIYKKAPDSRADIPLNAVWQAYLDWLNGKGRKLSSKSLVEQRGAFERFSAWAYSRGCKTMQDIDVATARAYILYVRASGRANKTLRNLADTLGHIWRAIDQLRGGLHNPWQAARPDDDGSAVRLEAFSVDEEIRVIEAAKALGHDWYLASIIARWTGLRYGDIATLEWCDVDFDRNVIDTIPNKTRKHKVRVIIPMSPPLRDALLARSKTSKELDGFIMPTHGAVYPSAPEPPYADALEAAGVDTKTHTFHSWRHTFRTRLAEAGVSDDVARRLGGWTNLKMAAHYDHASRLPELRDAIDKMS